MDASGIGSSRACVGCADDEDSAPAPIRPAEPAADSVPASRLSANGHKNADYIPHSIKVYYASIIHDHFLTLQFSLVCMT